MSSGATRELSERLQRRAARAGISIGHETSSWLERYLSLLAVWNRRINLTAFNLSRPNDQAIDRLLVEPLAAAEHLPTGSFTLIDIGSGGGSPAIPMKVVAPATTLTMVEPKTRKAVFLTEATRHLDLKGTRVEVARFESLLARPDLHEAFDVLSVRAVRVEPRTVVGLQAFIKPGGRLFWFRGEPGTATQTHIPPLRWEATHPLVESLRSYLVVFRKG